MESAAKLVTGIEGGGLKRALTELAQRAYIHEALRDGLLKLYGYASDDDGVRHAVLEDSKVGFDEAKFMIVFCSTASHLLIAKAEAAGLLTRGHARRPLGFMAAHTARRGSILSPRDSAPSRGRADDSVAVLRYLRPRTRRWYAAPPAPAPDKARKDARVRRRFGKAPAEGSTHGRR